MSFGPAYSGIREGLEEGVTPESKEEVWEQSRRKKTALRLSLDDALQALEPPPPWTHAESIQHVLELLAGLRI
jgi:hypothetical protein